MPPLIFTASFMFLAILLLIGVIYSQVRWWLKAILVISSLLFSGFFYQGYIASLGYPAPIDTPKLFRFVYGIVQEPSPLTNDPGAIYIWMLIDSNTPRAIVIPYSAENRKLIAQAKKRIADGQIVHMGKASKTDTMPSNAQGSSGQQNKSGVGSSVPYHVEGDVDLAFQPTPDTLPKKGTE